MKYKKIIKRFINQYVERRLEKWMITEIRKRTGPRYPDIFYKGLYPPSIKYISTYIKAFKVFTFKYVFFFKNKLLVLYCYIGNKKELYRERENRLIGSGKGQKYYLIDCVSSVHYNLYQIPDALLKIDKHIEKVYNLNNYLFKSNNTIFSPDDGGNYEFELLEKSLKREKYYFFLRMQKEARKAVAKQNGFLSVFQDKNLSIKDCLGQSSGCRSARQGSKGLLYCYDIAVKTVNEDLLYNYNLDRLFYIRVTPIKFRNASNKGFFAHDPVGIAEMAKKKKEHDLVLEKRKAGTDKMLAQIDRRLELEKKKKEEKLRLIKEKRILNEKKRIERAKEKIQKKKLIKQNKALRLEKKKKLQILKDQQVKERLILREKKMLLRLEERVKKLEDRYKLKYGDRIINYILERCKLMVFPTPSKIASFKLNCYLKLKPSFLKSIKSYKKIEDVLDSYVKLEPEEKKTRFISKRELERQKEKMEIDKIFEKINKEVERDIRLQELKEFKESKKLKSKIRNKKNSSNVKNE